MTELEPSKLKELKAEDIEKFLGIEGYWTSTKGIGGKVKSKVEDFEVWEVLRDGSDAEVELSRDVVLKGTGKFLLCLVRKSKVDTLEAVSRLAKAFKLKPSNIGICGIKDKRSLSTQFITIPSSRCVWLALKGKEELDGMLIKAIRYVNRPITSKDLSENKFRITVRELDGNLHDVERICGKVFSELKAKGFPNFFGHQRFGIIRPITHVVGKLLVKGNIKDAIETFLKEWTFIESEETRSIREKLQAFDNLNELINVMPRRLKYEKLILSNLVINREDFIGSIRKLPLRLRRLFVNAYASYLFNKALSKMISKGINLEEPEVNDIVAELDLYGSLTGRFIKVNEYNFTYISKAIKEGTFTLVFPVPGYRISIPNNHKGEILSSILEHEGIYLSDFKLKDIPEASEIGSYRRLIVKPIHLNILKINEGENSMTISFCLKRGVYATILLREILKCKNPLCYIGI